VFVCVWGSVSMACRCVSGASLTPASLLPTAAVPVAAAACGALSTYEYMSATASPKALG